MIELWNAYWPVILVGLLVGLVVGYLVFRPRQRVTLSSDTPVRPHMAVAATPPERAGKGIADEAARATGDVAGQILGTKVSAQLPGGDGEPDNLEALKGVGPKLAALLNAKGLTRFDQIAGLSPGQIEALDARPRRVPRPPHPRPHRRAGALSRPRRPRRLQPEVRRALEGKRSATTTPCFPRPPLPRSACASGG